MNISAMPSSLSAPLAGGPGTDVSLIGGVFIAVAVLTAVITALVLVSRARFRRRATRTTGTIVGHERTSSTTYSSFSSTSTSTGPMYYCVVEFALPGGETARGRTRTASSPPAGRVGGTATVFYDPADPRRVSLDTGRTSVMNGCVLALVAVLTLGFLLFGVFFLLLGMNGG